MFYAKTNMWTLSIKKEYGSGILATFLAIKEVDAKVHARSICKRMGVPKGKAQLVLGMKKATWSFK